MSKKKRPEFLLVLLLGLSLAFSSCSPAPLANDTDWLATARTRNYEAVDRIGLVCCGIRLLSNASDKDLFNSDEPSNDIANFKSAARTALIALRKKTNELPEVEAEDGFVEVDEAISNHFPDVLTINLGDPTSYPNGRNLEDSAFDKAIQEIFDRQIWNDGITGSQGFLESFPFLNPPTQSSSLR